ncbi:hypothetical protein JW859_04350 [bacterium]|nr:hypothetical protein [bacterium]
MAVREFNVTAWRALIAIVLAGTALATTGCPKKVETVVSTVKAMSSTLPFVKADLTAYDVGLAEWGPEFFDLGVFAGRPIAAYASPTGLYVALASKPVPQVAGDWVCLLVDPEPKIRFVLLAADETSAYVAYIAGRREESRRMLAACVAADPANPFSWQLEEIPDSQVDSIWRTIGLTDGRLTIVSRDRETRYPVLHHCEPAAEERDWETTELKSYPDVSTCLGLLDLDGTPALAYLQRDHMRLGLLREPGQTGEEDLTILTDNQAGISYSGASFAARGTGAGVVFIQGEPPVLRVALTADALEDSPTWQVHDLIAWEMLGSTDMLYWGDRPVVAFEAETALFAFVAAGPLPSHHNDWRTITLVEELGQSRFNGIEAVIVDDHLVAGYLRVDPSTQNTTLSFTVVELAE